MPDMPDSQDSRESLSKLTKAQLKVKLKNQHKKVSGNKPDLITRILGDENLGKYQPGHQQCKGRVKDDCLPPSCLLNTRGHCRETTNMTNKRHVRARGAWGKAKVGINKNRGLAQARHMREQIVEGFDEQVDEEERLERQAREGDEQLNEYIGDLVNIEVDEIREGCTKDKDCDEGLHCDKESGGCHTCVNDKNCGDNQYCDDDFACYDYEDVDEGGLPGNVYADGEDYPCNDCKADEQCYKDECYDTVEYINQFLLERVNWDDINDSDREVVLNELGIDTERDWDNKVMEYQDDLDLMKYTDWVKANNVEYDPRLLSEYENVEPGDKDYCTSINESELIADGKRKVCEGEFMEDTDNWTCKWKPNSEKCEKFKKWSEEMTNASGCTGIGRNTLDEYPNDENWKYVCRNREDCKINKNKTKCVNDYADLPQDAAGLVNTVSDIDANLPGKVSDIDEHPLSYEDALCDSSIGEIYDTYECDKEKYTTPCYRRDLNSCTGKPV